MESNGIFIVNFLQSIFKVTVNGMIGIFIDGI